MESKLFGSLEQQIIDILWKAEKPLKPLDVLKQLEGKHAYTTIMTVLKRMSDKRVLVRKMSGKAFVYSPVSKKETYIKNSLGTLYGSLVKNYGELAISQFVDIVKDNQGDMDLLKQFIDSENEKKK
jgi:predicted transcriptional regulator